MLYCLSQRLLANVQVLEYRLHTYETYQLDLHKKDPIETRFSALGQQDLGSIIVSSCTLIGKEFILPISPL